MHRVSSTLTVALGLCLVWTTAACGDEESPTPAAADTVAADAADAMGASDPGGAPEDVPVAGDDGGAPDATADVPAAVPSGNLVWLTSGGGATEDRCFSVAAAGDGTLVATCATQGAATWDVGSAAPTPVAGSVGGDVLFLGLAPEDGAIRWHLHLSTVGEDDPGFAANAALPDGRVAALVKLAGPVTGDVALPDAAAGDITLLVLTAGGAVDATLRLASGAAFEDTLGWAMSPRPGGGLAISVSFEGALTVLPGTSDEQALAPAHSEGMAVLFLDASLALERVLQLGGSNENVVGRGVPVAGGGLLVTGYMAPTLTLGTAAPLTLTDVGGAGAAFVARLDADGEPEWGVALEGAGEAYARAIVETSDGGVVVAGYFGLNQAQTSLTMPGLAGESLAGDDFGRGDLFVLSLAGDGTPRWLRGVRSPGGDTAVGLGAFADGSVVVSGSVCNNYGGTVTFSDGATAFVADVGTLLVRYGADGVRAWTRVATPAIGYGASVLADGSVAQAAEFIAGALWGFGEPGQVAPTNQGDVDGAVALHAP